MIATNAPSDSSSAVFTLAENPSLALIHPYEPDKVLLIHNQTAISQKQFLQSVHSLAALLPDGEYALNICEDRYYFLLTFCALLIKGSVNLLPPNRQPSVLTELAQGYANCYCILDKEQPCDLPSLNICDLLNTTFPATNPELPLLPAQQLAAIAFTSGSTGKPQANGKRWGTLAATAQLLARRFATAFSQPTIVATVPPQHMYGLETTSMMALHGSAVMHSAKPFYPADLQQLLQTITAPILLVSTPIHLRAMANAELAMAPVSGIISATAPLDTALAESCENLFNTRLWEIFGCTEAGCMATRLPTATATWELLEGFSLSQQEQCLIAKAPHLAEEALIQDQFELIDETHFLLLGRNADMINVAGKRASLAHLNNLLLKINGVSDGIIFSPKNNSQQNLRLVGLVVSELPEKVILQQLSQKIDAVFLPRPFRKVNSLPRNETGKLTQTALHELWEQLNERK